jgi:aspartyl-tRNA(Asn)/glutamyl-tRNA(Gln) amidotransferase subunit A
LPLALAVYYIVVPAEVSSNLARYDGIKYGFSDQSASSLDDVYGLSRDKGFNDENKRRILTGTYVLSSGYYDAYYLKAQTVRTKIINEFNAAFDEFDYLIGPVSPTPAFKLGENAQDPLKMYLADIMTVASNLTGCPAISIPSGEAHGLPIGTQLIGPQRSDAGLLNLGAGLQEALNG